MEQHYFDYAATTPVLPEVKAAMAAALEEYGNPSSLYAPGVRAHKALEGHRAAVAAALGCEPEEIIFTSGGTEGDNWAVAWAGQRKKGHIITSAIEHAAVLEPVKALQQQGFDVTYLPVDGNGKVSPGDVKKALREDTVLLSLMLVNNELGSVQPVAECVKLAKEFNPKIFCHTDAVQGFLKIPFTARGLGVDGLTISGHKIGAPKGVGAFYLKKGVRLKPLMLGGGQERGLRSGTESTVLTAALAAAVTAGQAHEKEHFAHVQKLRDETLARLTAALPDLKALAEGEAPHILAVTLPGYKSEVVVRFLSDRGVYLSSGSACHKGKPSHVFAALGLSKAERDGALRLSFGPETTMADVDALCEGLLAAKAVLFTTLS